MRIRPLLAAAAALGTLFLAFRSERPELYLGLGALLVFILLRVTVRFVRPARVHLPEDEIARAPRPKRAHSWRRWLVLLAVVIGSLLLIRALEKAAPERIDPVTGKPREVIWLLPKRAPYF